MTASPNPVRWPGQPAPPPLALYVHFPWCERKCPYCDFNSHAAPPELPEAAYLDALRQDLESWLPDSLARPVGSIYLGGGTPSLLQPATLECLLSDIRMLVRLEQDTEITMEANPGSVEAGRFRDYAAAGVNRLSLGVQSLDDASLQVLGRVHDAAAARAAAELAVAIFPRVNLDLITALPHQDVAAAVADARAVCAFGAEHVSLYRLTLEPGTRFFRQPPPGLPDTDAAADCEDAARAEVVAAGYARYEISAHARAGAASRHNLNYWRYGDYLGIGAGAHAKFTMTDGVWREVRHKAPGRYLEQVTRGAHVAQRHRVTARDLPFEFMLNALRLVDGFAEELFVRRTGLPLATVAGALATAVERGWLERDCGRIRPTLAGLDFQNDLCALFLPDSSPTRVPD